MSIQVRLCQFESTVVHFCSSRQFVFVKAKLLQTIFRHALFESCIVCKNTHPQDGNGKARLYTKHQQSVPHARGHNIQTMACSKGLVDYARDIT